MLKYYTNGVVDESGDITLFEDYDTLKTWYEDHYIVYIYDESKVNSFIFKYTHESNIRELIQV